MNKKTSIYKSLILASVWFGTHVGGGFAMGRQSVQFFVRFGWVSLFLPTIAMIVVGISFYYAWEFARLTKTYDFRGYVDGFYAPYEKSLASLVDFFFLFSVAMPVGASIAGGGELIKQLTGISYTVSCIITASIFLLIAIYGVELIRKTSLSFSIIIAVTLGSITLIGITKKIGNINYILSNKIMPEGTAMPAAILSAILYMSFQSNNAPMIAAADQMETRKDVFYTTVIGIVINSILLTLVCILELGYYPEIINEPIPNLAIANDLGNVLYAFYCIALYAAYITTAVTFLNAIGLRFENSFLFKNLKKDSIFIKKPKLKFQIVVLLGVLYAFLASMFGLTTIVGKGYTMLGYIYIPLVLLPQLIIGPIKCRRLRAKEKEMKKIQ